MFAKLAVIACFLSLTSAGGLYNSGWNSGSRLGYGGYAPALSYSNYNNYGSGRLAGYESGWAPQSSLSSGYNSYVSPQYTGAGYPATAVSSVSQYQVHSSPAVKTGLSLNYGSLGSNAYSPYAATGLSYGSQGYGGYGYGSQAYGGHGYGSQAYRGHGYSSQAYGGHGYGSPAYGGYGYGSQVYGGHGYGANKYSW